VNRLPPPIVALVAGLLLWSAGTVAAANPAAASPRGQHHRPAPEFPTRDPKLWINSAPLSIAGLRDRVVLLEVWTYG
jgi:hypothetical protein